MDRLEQVGMYALAWFTVPITLVGLWMCYLPRRDGTVTGVHVFLITLVFGLLLLFHRSIRQGHYDGLRTLWQVLKPAGAAGVLLIAVVVGSLSFGAFHGIPARQLTLSKESAGGGPLDIRQGRIRFVLRLQRGVRLPAA